MAVSYTAVVDVDGEGRNGGHVHSSDGLLETTLAIPKELGGAGDATNPEQLLAAGWSPLSAVLTPVLGGVDQATAVELAYAAHRICPYSKATRDNIPVTVNASAAA
ncbi:osmotically inducible protein OsmC [Streptomyces sp. NPDC051940]|uniref:osmotically inducible protein OsmC n=1 Tax=Streptomyces sp. NPDC051940 TaxID=3155675 RepID=UPI003430C886